jgi:periplasmic protein CpxP/Spy
MLRMMSVRGWLATAAAATAGLALAAMAPVQAGMTTGAAGPDPGERPVILVQATVPGPNVEANLGRLHQQLQITPAQQPKFDAFANAMRQNARMRPTAAPANPTAVDDLRLAIGDTQLQLLALRRLLPAMQALYATLSPAQQVTANQVFRQGPQ